MFKVLEAKGKKACNAVFSIKGKYPLRMKMILVVMMGQPCEDTENH